MKYQVCKNQYNGRFPVVATFDDMSLAKQYIDNHNWQKLVIIDTDHNRINYRVKNRQTLTSQMG